MAKLETYFDKQLNIQIVTSSGEITNQMVASYYKSVLENSHLPKDLKVLIDARGHNFVMVPRQMDEVVHGAHEACKSYRRMKEALLVDGSYNTMIAILFTERSRFHNYEAKVFSTKDAAIKWLCE